MGLVLGPQGHLPEMGHGCSLQSMAGVSHLGRLTGCLGMEGEPITRDWGLLGWPGMELPPRLPWVILLAGRLRC